MNNFNLPRSLKGGVLLDAQTQLLQATVLVVVSSGLLPVPNSIRWTFGFGEPAKTASIAAGLPPGSLEELRLSAEQYVREVPADTNERVGASFLERVQMCLEHGSAYFEHMRKKRETKRSDF